MSLHYYYTRALYSEESGYLPFSIPHVQAFHIPFFQCAIGVWLFLSPLGWSAVIDNWNYVFGKLCGAAVLGNLSHSVPVWL